MENGRARHRGRSRWADLFDVDEAKIAAMLTREQSVDIAASPGVIFDLIHNYSRRLDWDPFLKQAALLDGAQAAGVGVHSVCVAKNRLGGLGMETVYVVFDRPRVAAVKMVRGPAILQSFGASLRQDQIVPGTTRVTYKYTLETRPAWLRWLLTPICKWVFSRETRGRLAKLKSFLEAAPNKPRESIGRQTWR